MQSDVIALKVIQFYIHTTTILQDKYNNNSTRKLQEQ